jgi:Mg-chelatase subunit ChlD
MFAPMFGVSDFSPELAATATRSDRDIALVLDVSGSMSVNGKFQALTNGLNTFLNVLDQTPQDEFVSLATYASSAKAIQPMTNNLSEIRNGFASERPRGATAIGFGLNKGRVSILRDRNSRSFAQKAIVLMTDGRHNTGTPPEVVARNCAKKDIVVHTITFGDGADQSRMRRVAEITGGDFFHARNNLELEEVFETIARQLSVLLIE